MKKYLTYAAEFLTVILMFTMLWAMSLLELVI